MQQCSPKSCNWRSEHHSYVQWMFTLQGTNISPKNGILKMIFLFPSWDMLIPWRVSLVFYCNFVGFVSEEKIAGTTAISPVVPPVVAKGLASRRNLRRKASTLWKKDHVMHRWQKFRCRLPETYVSLCMNSQFFCWSMDLKLGTEIGGVPSGFWGTYADVLSLCSFLLQAWRSGPA